MKIDTSLEMKHRYIPKIWGNDMKVFLWIRVKEIKSKIEKLTGAKYNICLGNYYENGKFPTEKRKEVFPTLPPSLWELKESSDSEKEMVQKNLISHLKMEV
jgi:hypothetical protein